MWTLGLLKKPKPSDLLGGVRFEFCCMNLNIVDQKGEGASWNIQARLHQAKAFFPVYFNVESVCINH